MWWIILFVILGLFLFFRLFISLTGNWRATLNRVITQYVSMKQMEPEYTNKEIFKAVLDNRYPTPKRGVGGLMAKMHERKNSLKNKIETELESGISEKEKYTLPILIYTCLLIEENNYVGQNKTPEELIEPIKQEVVRQGFKKYC